LVVVANSLEYGNVIDQLFQSIPEAKTAYAQGEMPGDPLPYVVFSFLEESFFTPVVRLHRHDELEERILQFFERMAASSDAQLHDLLSVGLFETRFANGMLEIAVRRFGPRSKALTEKALKEFSKPRRVLG